MEVAGLESSVEICYDSEEQLEIKNIFSGGETMEISAFNPIIITPNADETIALFEALGFERWHQKTGINDEDINSVDMKDANGFRVNVDNFDEAYEFLLSRGFTNAQGGRITDTGSSKTTLMVSPSGFAINLAQHNDYRMAKTIVTSIVFAAKRHVWQRMI